MRGLFRPLEEYTNLSILTLGVLCFVFFLTLGVLRFVFFLSCMMEFSSESACFPFVARYFRYEQDFIILAVRLKMLTVPKF
jgi:hypothetical protein